MLTITIEKIDNGIVVGLPVAAHRRGYPIEQHFVFTETIARAGDIVAKFIAETPLEPSDDPRFGPVGQSPAEPHPLPAALGKI